MAAFPESWSREEQEKIVADATRVAEAWKRDEVSHAQEYHLQTAAENLRRHDIVALGQATIVPHRSTIADGPIRPPLAKTIR